MAILQFAAVFLRLFKKLNVTMFEAVPSSDNPNSCSIHNFTRGKFKGLLNDSVIWYFGFLTPSLLQILNFLFSFLEADRPHGTLLAGYFSKVNRRS